jgi:hypothetical protein
MSLLCGGIGRIPTSECLIFFKDINSQIAIKTQEIGLRGSVVSLFWNGIGGWLCAPAAQ